MRKYIFISVVIAILGCECARPESQNYNLSDAKLLEDSSSFDKKETTKSVQNKTPKYNEQGRVTYIKDSSDNNFYWIYFILLFLVLGYELYLIQKLIKMNEKKKKSNSRIDATSSTQKIYEELEISTEREFLILRKLEEIQKSLNQNQFVNKSSVVNSVQTSIPSSNKEITVNEKIYLRKAYSDGFVEESSKEDADCLLYLNTLEFEFLDDTEKVRKLIKRIDRYEGVCSTKGELGTASRIINEKRGTCKKDVYWKVVKKAEIKFV